MSAARRLDSIEIGHALCAMSGWTLRFQHVQAMTYIAHAVHLAETGEPLARDGFEATDFGPRAERLHRAIRMFGAGAVRPPLRWPFAKRQEPVGDAADAVLRRVYARLKDHSPGQLIALTHEDGGPWAKRYAPGHRVPIDDAEIARWAKAKLTAPPRKDPEDMTKKIEDAAARDEPIDRASADGVEWRLGMRVKGLVAATGCTGETGEEVTVEPGWDGEIVGLVDRTDGSGLNIEVSITVPGREDPDDTIVNVFDDACGVRTACIEPAALGAPRYKEVKITVRIIMPIGDDVKGHDLAEVGHEMDIGDWCGTMELASETPLADDEVTAALERVGNDGTFFP